MSKSNVNKIILMGDLGRDPELRYTAKGNPMLNLSLATTREFKNAEGELRRETSWHRATIWGKRAEVCAKYLTKGSRVYLEGELRMQTYTDKNGQSRKSAEIHVDEIRNLGRAKSSEMQGQPVELPAASLSQ